MKIRCRQQDKEEAKKLCCWVSFSLHKLTLILVHNLWDWRDGNDEARKRHETIKWNEYCDVLSAVESVRRFDRCYYRRPPDLDRARLLKVD